MKKILLVVFLSLIIPEAHAEFIGEKETLHDLPKFFVFIAMAPGPEGKIAETTLRTDVEVRLRKAGILIFDRKEPYPTNIPYLSISYTQSGIGLNIDLSLIQEVCLVSRPTSTAHAATWARSMTGTGRNATYIRQAIRQAIKDLTDMFINDYLSVNPRTH